MAIEENAQDEIFHKSVPVTVNSHIKRLCANVFILGELSLCSFLDFVSNETNFNIPKNRITRGVTEDVISDRMKKKLGLHIKKGAKFLMELTRGSTNINAPE